MTGTALHTRLNWTAVVALGLVMALGAGCRRAKSADGGPLDASVTSSAVPADAGSSRPAAAFGDQYLIILSSSPNPGQELPSLKKLEAAPELGASVARLDSSEFKNLKPCFEVVIAQAFSELQSARTWARSLEKLGIEHYIKNAGRYVGPSEAMRAHCEARRLDRSSSCGGVRFAEVWSDRVFMALDEEVEAPSGMKPLDGDRRAWYARRPESVHGAFRVGDRYDRFGDSDARCRIENFAVLTRGEPHFSYFRGEDGTIFDTPPENDAPGCGSPELFAELECRGSVEGVTLVVPAEDRRFVRYDEEGEASGELREHSMAAMRLDRFVRTAAQEVRRRADELQQPLREESQLRVFTKGERRFVVATQRLFTGEGNTSCGAEDLLVEVSGVFRLARDQSLSIALPFRRSEGVEIRGLIDLEGDGAPELLEESPFGVSSVRGSEDHPRCAVVVPYCDCPC